MLLTVQGKSIYYVHTYIRSLVLLRRVPFELHTATSVLLSRSNKNGETCTNTHVRVVLQSFSEDTGIFAELVHIKESPTRMDPEPSVDYVRRAVLYADDPCIIVSLSPREPTKIMEVIVEVCRAFTITISKT